MAGTAGGTWAEFDGAQALARAVAELQARGFRRLETYTPRPVPRPERGETSWRSRLPHWTFGVAVVAAMAGYGIQWYANVVAYPLNAGGRPTHAVPAFVYVTFEVMVLCAALAVFVGWMISLRLPAPWHPAFEIEGFESASSDGYWVAVAEEGPDGRAGEVRRILEELGARRVVQGEVGRELEGSGG